MDTNGLPVHLALTPGEAHDNRLCSVLLLADRGYDADWIRELARQKEHGRTFRRNEIVKTRSASARICIVRNLIERLVNNIKKCRRVATRYDKLAANYPAFVKLASIRIWLRANESTA